MPSLYQRILGPDFQHLAPTLQQFHRAHAAPLRLEGEVSIAWGPHWISQLLCRLLRLPTPCQSSACTVRLVQHAHGTETWQRRMNGQEMTSQQSAAPATGHSTRHLLESAFPYTLVIASRIRRGALWQRSYSGRLLGWSLPKCLHMRVIAAERGTGAAQFSFDVRLYLPWCGRLLPLLHYRGHLQF